MESAILDVAARVGGPVIVALLFLRYLTAKDKRDQERHKVNQAELAMIGEACHKHTQELAARYEKLASENTQAIRENSNIQGQVTAMLRRINGGG